MLVPNLTLFPCGFNKYFKHIITNNLVVLTTKVVVEEAKKLDVLQIVLIQTVRVRKA